MILVDSSVWIDYFRGDVTPETNMLDVLLGDELLAIGDLILVEVLQGFADARAFARAAELLSGLTVVPLCGRDLAFQAAQNYRTLRERGVTIRKTIDTVIATRCIESDYKLLHSDRDFKPFEKHLGLQSVL